MKILHQPVLLAEALKALALKPGETVVDATLGGGGHSLEIAKTLGPGGRLIGIDTEAAALERAKERLTGVACRLDFVHSNFRHLDAILTDLGLSTIDALLLDLGFSSDQLETSGRGFSFQRDEPLLMTLADNPGPNDLTAEKIVNDWPEEELARIIYEYGEERNSRRIAKAIVAARAKKPITRSTELAAVIEQAAPTRRGRLHPATKTFQALRVAVNDEFGALREVLAAGWQHLAPGGRLAVITFQGLEGQIFKEFAHSLRGPAGSPKLVKITKSLGPTHAEVLQNPRSRSARLRLITKL